MLFDKNGFYLIEPQNKDYDFAIDIMGGTNQNFNVYDLTEALEKGNVFPNLYRPYKNYKAGKLNPKTEREKMLLEIQKLDFSINDLNLYLDMYPEDKESYRLFKSYVEECKKKKNAYTNVFGPLTLDSLTDEYEWSTGVWPWEEGGM